MIRFWCTTLFLSLALTAAAQNNPRDRFYDFDLSETAEITLITTYAGGPLYSAWGHSALRVTDPDRRFDALYNYGVFDTRDPAFYLNFTRGFLSYQLERASFRAAFFSARDQGRAVISQTLNLTLSQKQALFHFLETNHLPENRYYPYDFLFDNCATRIRDALETVLGDTLRFTGQPDPQWTFRQLLDYDLRDRALDDFGIDLVLGITTDRIATSREIMFSPLWMEKAFAEAQVRTDSLWQPLVSQTDTLFWVENADARPEGFPWFRVIFSILFLLSLAQTFLVQKSPKWGWGMYLFDGIFFFLAGLVGWVVCLLWFATEHHTTIQNWTLFWAWPTHLFIAFWLWRKKKPRWMTRYFQMASVVLTIFLLGWFWWPQEFHPAILPLALLLLLRTAWHGFGPRKKQSTTPAISTL